MSASDRAANFVKNGNLEGFYLWQAIALKVKQLQDERERPAETN
jgi:hypothetical protein